MDNVALAIPIISIILSMTLGGIAIIAWHRHKLRELDQRHKERMAAIEKGLEVPADHPVTEPAGNGRQRVQPRYLLRGLVWLGIGLALTLGRRDEFAWGMSTGWGWIAVGVGAAYLIFYIVEGRRPSPPERPQPPTDKAP
jgi:hypothetical protein